MSYLFYHIMFCFFVFNHHSCISIIITMSYLTLNTCVWQCACVPIYLFNYYSVYKIKKLDNTLSSSSSVVCVRACVCVCITAVLEGVVANAVPTLTSYLLLCVLTEHKQQLIVKSWQLYYIEHIFEVFVVAQWCIIVDYKIILQFYCVYYISQVLGLCATVLNTNEPSCSTEEQIVTLFEFKNCFLTAMHIPFKSKGITNLLLCDCLTSKLHISVFQLCTYTYIKFFVITVF